MSRINLSLVVGRETATIKRALTETEIEALGEKLATTVQELNDEANAWKEESKAYNDAKKQKTEYLKDLSKQRISGIMEGDFEVGLMLDEDGSTMLQIDMESGEVVGRRRATLAEKQMRIEFDDATVRAING